VRRFKIPEELVDGSFGENALVNSASVGVGSIQQIEELLNSRDIEAGLLDAPWKYE
jgi:hypothetical protein